MGNAYVRAHSLFHPFPFQCQNVKLWTNFENRYTHAFLSFALAFYYHATAGYKYALGHKFRLKCALPYLHFCLNAHCLIANGQFAYKSIVQMASTDTIPSHFTRYENPFSCLQYQPCLTKSGARQQKRVIFKQQQQKIGGPFEVLYQIHISKYKMVFLSL